MESVISFDVSSDGAKINSGCERLRDSQCHVLINAGLYQLSGVVVGCANTGSHAARGTLESNTSVFTEHKQRRL